MNETDTNMPSPERDVEIERLQSEIQQLKDEKEALLQQGLQKQKQHSVAVRNGWAKALAVIAVVLFTFSVTAVWLNRTVTNTDAWVSTMSPLASQPAIQNYVASEASNAIIGRLDIESLVKQALPPEAQPLAGPVTVAVEGFIRQTAQRFTQSKQFQTLWTQINKEGHTIIVAVINGEPEAIKTSNGQVTLNIGTVVVNIKERLSAAGLTFVNNIPTSSLGNKEIVLFQSSELDQISTALRIMSRAALILPLLTLLLAVGSISLATDRRKISLWLGVGTIIIMVLSLVVIYLAQYPFIQRLQSFDVPDQVASAIYSTVLRNLIGLQIWYIIIGFGVALAAVFLGPSSWAVSLRHGMQNGLRGIVPNRDFGSFGEWVNTYAKALRTAGYIVATLLLIIPAQRTFGYLLAVLLGLGVWTALVEFFRRHSPSQIKAPIAEGGPGINNEPAA
jgi:ElaB/YqjD/DUF883 family membrane-anchored ribosome-binding protein